MLCCVFFLSSTYPKAVRGKYTISSTLARTPKHYYCPNILLKCYKIRFYWAHMYHWHTHKLLHWRAKLFFFNKPVFSPGCKYQVNLLISGVLSFISFHLVAFESSIYSLCAVFRLTQKQLKGKEISLRMPAALCVPGHVFGSSSFRHDSLEYAGV